MRNLFILLLALLVPVAVFAADEIPSGEKSLWLIDMIRQGGPVMYPILLCSLLGVTLMIERLYALREKHILSAEYIEEIRNFWMRNEIEKAIERCNTLDLPLYRIIKAGLLHCRHGVYEIERAIESAGQHESSLLSKNLRMLGAMANLAPMLGLLGTVTGMITAFDAIAVSGSSGNQGLVASGISQALITTAAGLIVGIPILLSYHFIKGRIEYFIIEMEEISLSLVEELIHKKNMI